MNTTLEEDRDALNNLFLETDAPTLDDTSDLLAPTLIIDIDAINKEAADTASFITERLANYYFDQQYIDNHPYVAPKISSEMDNIRRLRKMLKVNELAQDSLLQSISVNASKGALYSALTSLQQATLNIQRQLDDLVNELEDIFRKMQDECKTTFSEKDKDVAEDGSMYVRGSRDFIKELTQKLYGEKKTIIDTQTGEVLSSTTNYTIQEL